MTKITTSPQYRWPTLVACFVSIFLSGCPAPPSPEEAAENLPPAGSTIKLAVVDDSALADALLQLRGEWNAQAGFSYDIIRTSQEDLLAGPSLPADAVICPVHLLGTLAEKGQLAPVPRAEMESDREEWSTVFSLLRAQEASWKSQAMAIPFGSPVLVCYYRADLLEKLNRDPPTTWTEYLELAQLLADREKLGEAAPPPDSPFWGTVEPLGPGWAGIVLLGRAAPYATHRNSYSTLFNIDSMEPMIAGTPFVRALEELVATAKVASPDQLTLDAHATRAEFWAGRSGMALTWPTAAPIDLPDAPDGLRVGFVELPGAEEVYSPDSQRWETVRENEDPHVPLLATGGRLGVVSTGCRWPDAVFRLLTWLSGERWGRQVSALTSATTLFRQSHLNSPADWVEKGVSPGMAAEYAALTEQTFRRQRRLLCLRIPGRAEYLEALDKAVHAAVSGDQTPQAALDQAAAEWAEITQRLGAEAQVSAYRASLGLD
jgi:multiple sugar transport system substrate-binding protein